MTLRVNPVTLRVNPVTLRVNPVTIVKRDHQGNPREAIAAAHSSTSGKLLPSDSFPQSSYVRWATFQYTDCCLLSGQRVYHTIPSSGSGNPGTNDDETTYGYDSMRRRNRTVAPGGTIRFDIFDVRNQVVESFAGTDDTGATESDPTGGGASGNSPSRRRSTRISATAFSMISVAEAESHMSRSDLIRGCSIERMVGTVLVGTPRGFSSVPGPIRAGGRVAMGRQSTPFCYLPP